MENRSFTSVSGSPKSQLFRPGSRSPSTCPRSSRSCSTNSTSWRTSKQEFRTLILRNVFRTLNLFMFHKDDVVSFFFQKRIKSHRCKGNEHESLLQRPGKGKIWLFYKSVIIMVTPEKLKLEMGNIIFFSVRTCLVAFDEAHVLGDDCRGLRPDSRIIKVMRECGFEPGAVPVLGWNSARIHYSIWG